MKRTSITPLVLGMSLWLVLYALVNQLMAQGFIIPRPFPHRFQGLPFLTEHRVNVKIINQAARVEVVQVFYNDSEFPIEGNYYFPLPKDASVSDFQMYADGKVLAGEILEREKARSIYEDIVRRNIDPALLEYADHHLFSAKIFPIPPKKERKIVLKYSSVLQLSGDLVRFVYPLRGEFQSGRSARPPQFLFPEDIPWDERPKKNDEARHEGGKPSDRDISQVIFVDLTSSIPLKNIYSPSHSVEIVRKDDHHATINFEGKRSETPKNFLLYYSFAQGDFGVNLLTYRSDDTDEPGFFMLLLSPKTEIADQEILDKDVVFVLDVSGSMSGEKIEQAKAALRYCIKHLNQNDRFNLIPFSTELKPFKDQLVSASEYRKEALSFIDKLEANGGTNINDAMLQALDLKFDRNRPASLVFITDGLPTRGETDIGKIIRNVSEKNKDAIKIFTFGVGYDVNTLLLDKIAAMSHAVSDYIEPNEQIEQKIASLYDKISHSILANVSINYGAIHVEDVFPQQIPDLYKGSQLTILGRYSGKKKDTIVLIGKAGDQTKRFSYEADFSQSSRDHHFIPHLWATRKIGYLMDEIRLHGETKELKDEIVRLSKKYGVMSPYTSFLIQDQDMAAVPFMEIGEPSLIKLAPQIDSDMRLLNNAKSANAIVDKGRIAVRMSMETRAMRETESLPSSPLVKRVAGRTFVFANEFWTDTEYRNENTINIRYGSETYSALLLNYPRAAKFLALGKNIIFKFQNWFIKISEHSETNITPAELRRLLK